MACFLVPAAEAIVTTVAAKVIAGVLAAAVLVGGGTAIARSRTKKQPEPPPPTETAAPVEPTAAVAPTTPPITTPAPTPTSTPEPTPEPEKDPKIEALLSFLDERYEGHCVVYAKLCDLDGDDEEELVYALNSLQATIIGSWNGEGQFTGLSSRGTPGIYRNAATGNLWNGIHRSPGEKSYEYYVFTRNDLTESFSHNMVTQDGSYMFYSGPKSDAKLQHVSAGVYNAELAKFELVESFPFDTPLSAADAAQYADTVEAVRAELLERLYLP